MYKMAIMRNEGLRVDCEKKNKPSIYHNIINMNRPYNKRKAQEIQRCRRKILKTAFSNSPTFTSANISDKQQNIIMISNGRKILPKRQKSIEEIHITLTTVEIKNNQGERSFILY